MNKPLLWLAALLLFGCAAPEPDLDDLAREYLFLELSMALHDDALVAYYVERDNADLEERWARFGKLLSSPMLPKDLL